MKTLYFFFCILMIINIQHLVAQNQVDHGQERYVNGFQQNIFDKINHSESIEPLDLFLSLDSQMTKDKSSKILQDLELFCDKLKEKKAKRFNEKFLEYVFYKVHKTYLKSYTLNSPTYLTFETGNYDCVSGTALYALVLNKLEIPFTIRETKFHAYLTTHYNNKTQLWESTDPLDGFINDTEEVKKRESHYQKQVEKNESYYVFDGAINESIDLMKLAGLEYYNVGIVSYNNKRIEVSLGLFEKALHLYSSNRIQEIFKMGLDALAREVHYTKSTGLAQSYNYFSKIVND